jgi:hypothetical protein
MRSAAPSQTIRDRTVYTTVLTSTRCAQRVSRDARRVAVAYFSSSRFQRQRLVTH